MANEGYILITGAAKRIGRHMALKLADAGHDIAVHFNGSNAEAEAVVGQIKAIGRKAVAIKADLKSMDQVKALIPEASRAMGTHAKALINNASLFEEDDIHNFTTDGWDSHMAVNTEAPLMLTQAFAKALPGGTAGNVINIIDQRVWKPNPQFLTYTASKAALYALTRTTAQALAPTIRVNAIGPGPVLESIHQTGDSQKCTPWARAVVG